VFLHEGSYWIVENPEAVPRAYVPHRVETVAREGQLLALLAAPSFYPAEVAYVERPLDLPDACRGSATIVEEAPMRISIRAEMETPGLLVLSDLLYDGWRVTVNGRPAEIMRTNFALRGVELGPGQSVVVFEYAPAGFRRGVIGMLVALAASLIWIAWGCLTPARSE
jgi:uncharacterized membrane protein YfhO